jgi:flagellin
MLGITQGTLSSSTEKLSSGYKVNRAADDAAGLSISEKMRKQIRGLTQASSNAEDGISSVQTAEGALSEVHDMLQRMNELATKAANGTMSVDDRQTIQDEISQLTTEIDRVSETTKFNETYLLQGDGTKGTKKLEAHDAGLDGTLTENVNGTVTFKTDALKVGDSVTIGGTEYNIVGSKRTTDYASMVGFKGNNGDTITQNGVTYTISVAQANISNLDDVSAQAIDVVDSSGNKFSITLNEGAIYTTTLGVSTTLVGNATNLSGGFDGANAGITEAAAKKYAWQAGDTIVDEDGVEYTYVDTNKDAYALDGVLHTASGFYKTEGSKATDSAYTIKEGDVYTVSSGKITSSITNGSSSAGGSDVNTGIVSVNDLQAYIKTLKEGDVVTIHNNSNDADGVEYTVAAETVKSGKDVGNITADDLAQLVQAGNWIDVNGDNYYAIDVASDSKTDISVQEAYNKMADALKQASSVGADTEATVRQKGNGEFEITKGTVEVANGLSFNLHVGADADMTNKITVNLDTMSSAGLGVKNLNVVDKTGEAATYAIDAISDAIATVSAQRSLLGAVQNRLEHTIKNLDNVVENTTSAESQIRDTDMATEMVKYSNANILSQAGQSMLAQANQSNQGVLSLLG